MRLFATVALAAFSAERPRRVGAGCMAASSKSVVVAFPTDRTAAVPQSAKARRRFLAELIRRRERDAFWAALRLAGARR